MSKDIHGRTRTQWAFQWGMWWVAVAVFLFIGFHLSRPLWDADKLIEEKRQSCKDNGKVMVKEEVRFGSNYYCKDKS